MNNLTRTFALVALPTEVAFRGLAFSNVIARTNGEQPNEAAGFVFQPCILVPDTIATLAERQGEKSVEYLGSDGEPTTDVYKAFRLNLWKPANELAVAPEGWTLVEHAFANAPQPLGTDYFCAHTAPDMANAAAVIAEFCAAPEVPPPAPVPAIISPRQLRLWLVSNGISLATIEAALPDEAARIEWEYSTEVRRDHPLTVALASSLGIDADKAFREASLL